MKSPPLTFRSIWLTVILGVLIATAPTWMNRHVESNYDAPWVHPSLTAH